MAARSITSTTRSAVDALRLLRLRRGRLLLVPPVLLRFESPLCRAAHRYRHRVARRTRVVAVIGSLGKTTTTRAAAVALGLPRPPQAGNFGSRLALTVLRIRPWQRLAVVEAGIDGPGQMAGNARMLEPDVVIVTSIRSDHHRSFTSIEHKRDEKAEMVRALGAEGVAVLNGDDEHVRWMATQTTARVVTFGLGESNDVRATDVVAGANGLALTVHVDGATVRVHTRLLGAHMAYAVLAAIAAAATCGVAAEEAARRIETLDAPPGRLDVLDARDGVTVVDDSFKSGIESILSALDTFADFPAKRRLVVLGSIESPEGSAGPQYRMLGERMTIFDHAYLVGSRGLRTLIASAVAAGAERESFTYTRSELYDALSLLRADLQPGDAVLVKGPSSSRLERIALALTGRDVRCPAKICKVPLIITCGECPLLERDDDATFENVHVRRFVSRDAQ